jgi:hypothetical protein
MGNAQYLLRKSRMFVAQQFDMGELLSTYVNRLLIICVGNRYLFMQFHLVKNV